MRVTLAYKKAFINFIWSLGGSGCHLSSRPDQGLLRAMVTVTIEEFKSEATQPFAGLLYCFQCNLTKGSMSTFFLLSQGLSLYAIVAVPELTL